MSIERLRIATRKSPLALWQAEHVRARLLEAHPGLQVELVTMTTQGDRVLDSPLARIGGKGLFVKELEQGMLEGRADMAVHSMKDVPAEFPPGWASAPYSSVRTRGMPSFRTAMGRSRNCRRAPVSEPPVCAASASCAPGVRICNCSTCAAT